MGLRVAMPIIAATVYGRADGKAFVMATAEDLSGFSWLFRRQAGEFVRFGCRQVAAHTEAGQCESILPDEENANLQYVCHGHCEAGGRLVGTMVTDPEYPPKIVYRLLSQLMVAFAEMHGDSMAVRSKPTEDLALEFPPLQEFLAKYQDPRDADKTFAIRADLDETREVMYKTIDQVLKRGESIESIMEKSEDLSASSMKFYTTSKKTRCCTIL